MLNQRNEFLNMFPNCTGSSLYLLPQLLQGVSQNSQIHSAIWKFFLIICPNLKKKFSTSADWISILTLKRQEYYIMKKKYFIKPEEDEDSVDPLVVTKNSDWNQFFHDEDLRNEISRDTVRAFQELMFKKY